MSGFRHLGDTVLHQGAVITLCRSEFAAPDGARFERDVVRHPGRVSASWSGPRGLTGSNVTSWVSRPRRPPAVS